MKSIALSNVDANNMCTYVKNKEVHISIIDAISSMDSIAITGRIGVGKTRLYREILRLLSLSKHAEGYGAYTCIDGVGLSEVETIKKRLTGENSREKQAVLFTAHYKDDAALLGVFPDFDGLHIHIN